MINAFAYEPKTRIHYGPGLVHEAGIFVKSIVANIQSVLIVSDPGVVASGLTQGLITSLEQQGIKIALFSDIKSDPTAASIDQAADMIRANAPQVVIGFGGGSAMDVAKIATVVATQNAPADDYSCVAEGLPQPGRTTVMIPTTSGTGAEVTRSVVFTNSRGHKVWAWGHETCPDWAILDPELTLGLPAPLTAMTGLDALVHAIEACGHPNASPVSTAYALEGIRLACRSLETAYHHGNDINARGEMSIAACFGGKALDTAGCGLAHGMGHALGTLAGIPHGRAVSLVLNAAIAWNVESAVPIYARIAKAMGVDEKGMDERAAAQAAATNFKRLITALGIEVSVKGDGIGPEDVDRLVEFSLEEENKGMCETNCRIPSTDDLQVIAARVLSR